MIVLLHAINIISLSWIDQFFCNLEVRMIMVGLSRWSKSRPFCVSLPSTNLLHHLPVHRVLPSHFYHPHHLLIVIMIRPFQGTFITFNSIVFSFNLIEALIFHPPQDPHHHQTKQGGDPSGCDGGVAEGSSLFRWPPGYHHLAAPPTKAQMQAVYPG